MSVADCRIDVTVFVFSAPKVTKVSWWMMNYGGRTPKRHYLYSNSPHMAKLQAGKLQNYLKDESQPSRSSQTCKHYINENGKRCWVGTASLKKTECLVHQQCSSFCSRSVLGPSWIEPGMRNHVFLKTYKPATPVPQVDRSPQPRQYPPRFALKAVSLFNDLVGDKAGVPRLPEHIPSIQEICDAVAFEGGWAEAEMGEIIRYVRGARGSKSQKSTGSFSPKFCQVNMSLLSARVLGPCLKRVLRLDC